MIKMFILKTTSRHRWITVGFMFVCLFNRSLLAETRLSPDGTRLEQNAQARL